MIRLAVDAAVGERQKRARLVYGVSVHVSFLNLLRCLLRCICLSRGVSGVLCERKVGGASKVGTRRANTDPLSHSLPRSLARVNGLKL